MASEMQLKYGCNPNQKPSRIYMEDGSDLPITVLNGKLLNPVKSRSAGWKPLHRIPALGPALPDMPHVQPQLPA